MAIDGTNFTHAYCPNCQEVTPARLAPNSDTSSDLICDRQDALCAFVIATVFTGPVPKTEA